MPGKGHVLLRDWLGNLANTGLYGVTWEDSTRSAVRIPWDSSKKRLSRDTDTIFRAYATIKGRVDSSKPPEWRQSLRCALEKMLQCEVDGAKQSPPEPFRVYRLFSHAPGSSHNQGLADISQMPEFQPNEMAHLQNSFGDLNIEPPIVTGMLVPRGAGGGVDPVLDPARENGAFCGPEVCVVTHQEVAYHPDLPTAPSQQQQQHQHHHHHHHHVVLPSGFYQDGPVPLAQLLAHDSNVSMESVGSFQGVAAVPPVSPVQLLVHRLKVTVSYFGQVVLRTEVGSADGAPVGCLICNDEWQSSEVARHALPGLAEPRVLRLPAPPRELARREEVEERIAVMGSGLLLEATTNGVEVTRLCRCRVFYSGPGMHASETPNALPRADNRTRARARTLIYSFADFLRKIGAWYDSGTDARQRALPDCDVILCLGSKWPNGTAAHNKAITVQVTHVHSEMLLADAAGKEGPEVSVPNSEDIILMMMRYNHTSDHAETR